MTKITVHKNSCGDVVGFTAKGHASSEEAGKNIYCAAVSAITQTAVIGLEEVARVNVDYNMSDGFLSAHIDDVAAKQERCKTIFETMLHGLASFDEANPRRIQIIEEVQ